MANGRKQPLALTACLYDSMCMCSQQLFRLYAAALLSLHIAAACCCLHDHVCSNITSHVAQRDEPSIKKVRQTYCTACMQSLATSMLLGVLGVSDWSQLGRLYGRKCIPSTLTQMAESTWQRCAAVVRAVVQTADKAQTLCFSSCLFVCPAEHGDCITGSANHAGHVDCMSHVTQHKVVTLVHAQQCCPLRCTVMTILADFECDMSDLL